MPIRRLLLACAAVAAGAIAVFGSTGSAPADPPQDPLTALTTRGDRYIPKPAGTQETLKFWFGPYVVPPGHDANRVDFDIPIQDGYIIAVEPGMRRVNDLTEPSHQEGHIHHAHWFALDPGNEEDNYTGGNTEWIFGNGDEETRADFQERTNADPNGPIYGQFTGKSGPQLMIYMLHNKTSQPLPVYIVLDVTFLHGTREEIRAAKKRDVHDISGVLFGRTFSVPRQRTGDGIFTSNEERRGAIEWTSTVEGTMIGTGGHLHPGGLKVIVENLGSKERPCGQTGDAQQGTHLLTSEALFNHGVKFSEDFQMSVTHPAWRAPIRKGDRIRITGVYENKDHAWYDVMTHEGIYVDEAQKPAEGCKPYLVGGLKEQTVKTVRKKHKHVVRVKIRSKLRGKRSRSVRRVKVHWHKVKVKQGISLTEGVPNRPWHPHPLDRLCGVEGWGPCERPDENIPAGPVTDTVTIANFLYLPGDYGASGDQRLRPRVKKGTALKFFNADQLAGIRHSVTTCQWPCNGSYVANYPFPDGDWDSGTMGYDPVDGGSPSPFAETPTNLAVGKYSYFCRIHPWMRGAFEVID